MTGLPDILAPQLDVVLCGTAVGEKSASRGHYYAGPGNIFWRLLHDSGLTPASLTPADDATLPKYGLGLTDLAKNIVQSHDRALPYDLESLVVKLETYRPRWIAFTSLKGAQQAARLAGLRAASVRIGPQAWTLGPSAVYALPSPSGANNAMSYTERLGHWTAMARAVRP